MKFSQTLLWLAPCLLALTDAADKRTVSSQLGAYPVTVSDHEIRTNRTDKLAPTPQKRRLMVTVYRPHLDTFICPALSQKFIPYVPDAVAKGLNDLLSGPYGVTTAEYETLQRVNCTIPFASTNSSDAAPVILFSPGLQSSRYAHHTQLQALASTGYTVVAVDHTWDAVAVVFTDGHVVPSNLSNADINSDDFYVLDNYIGGLVQPVRQADLVSVLDALETRQIPGYSGAHGQFKAGVFGHSVGGSTSAGVLKNESRLVGGINMDGTFFGAIRNETLKKPFLMMQEENGDTFTWPDFYADVLKGWKAWTAFNSTRHLSFSDMPVLVDLLNNRNGPNSVNATRLAGSISSQRNSELDWRYIVSFFDFLLKGEQPKLLQKPSFMFPDVRLLGYSG